MTPLPRFALVSLAGLSLLSCTTTADGPDNASSDQSETPVDGDEFRTFDVDGAEIWTRSELAELPESATTIQLTSPLIDNGLGPKLCSSGVLEPFPLQCAGPVVTGLTGDWWTQETDGVRGGTRTVTVTWPPIDNSVELINDQTPTPEPWPDHPTRLELPRECDTIEQFVDYQTLRDWEDANPDRNSHVRVVENATIAVLATDGDLDAIRTELAEGTLQACVAPIGYGREELQAAQDALIDLMRTDSYIKTVGGGYAYNRVTVELLVADHDTITTIVDAVDHPDILLITGIAKIVDGD